MQQLKPKFDAIGMLDAIYAEAVRPRSDWLASSVEIVRPYLDAGLGVVVYEFQLRGPEVAIGSPRSMVGDAELVTVVRESFSISTKSMRDLAYRNGPIITLNEVLGMSIRDFAPTAHLAKRIGAANWISVQAADVDGRGVKFDAPLPPGKEFSALDRRRWCKLARHFVAAARLHRNLARVTSDTDGLIDPSSSRVELSLAATHARGELQRAALSITQARKGAANQDEALSLWQVLASGRWSLIANSSADSGRRLVIYENSPQAPDPRALTKRERVIAQLAALGYSNKLIGYELGIAESTVSVLLTRLRRKLRIRSRAELVELVTSLAETTAPIEQLSSGRVVVGVLPDQDQNVPSVLTQAEGEVCKLAARGLSNAAIAKQRQTSLRTVANQLASIYAKLGIDSRANLASRLRRTP